MPFIELYQHHDEDVRGWLRRRLRIEDPLPYRVKVAEEGAFLRLTHRSGATIALPLAAFAPNFRRLLLERCGTRAAEPDLCRARSVTFTLGGAGVVHFRDEHPTDARLAVLEFAGELPRPTPLPQGLVEFLLDPLRFLGQDITLPVERVEHDPEGDLRLIGETFVLKLRVRDFPPELLRRLAALCFKGSSSPFCRAREARFLLLRRGGPFGSYFLVDRPSIAWLDSWESPPVPKVPGRPRDGLDLQAGMAVIAGDAARLDSGRVDLLSGEGTAPPLFALDLKDFVPEERERLLRFCSQRYPVRFEAAFCRFASFTFERPRPPDFELNPPKVSWQRELPPAAPADAIPLIDFPAFFADPDRYRSRRIRLQADFLIATEEEDREVFLAWTDGQARPERVAIPRQKLQRPELERIARCRDPESAKKFCAIEWLDVEIDYVSDYQGYVDRIASRRELRLRWKTPDPEQR